MTENQRGDGPHKYRPGELLAVRPEALWKWVPNTYEGIKDGMDQATIDFFHHELLGGWIDDNGMVEGKQLNVVASVMLHHPLYGNVVFCGPEPTLEGETLPAEESVLRAIMSLCEIWQEVEFRAERMGQNLQLFANPFTVPPPRFIPLPDDWVPGDPIPGGLFDE